MTAAVSIDIVVRATDWALPPEMLVAGSSFGPGRIDLGLDPSQEATDDDLHQAILRTVYHEFHHVLRWDGPGYGRTLGEALVSEGLAQAFLHEAMTCAPEPWEQAVIGSTLDEIRPDAFAQFDDQTYNHAAWFFGAAQYTKWAGYSLGLDIVQRYLSENSGASALGSATLPADNFKTFLA